ncbi:hypothetical protein VKT23_010709 [Stygiomarasmius scandens]|uniref:MYND-type domain-containing protein n=1 Tax=Marasmiellus scandens TaxID=2682957 RepID=A0ABR1JBW3_9AGAR
MSSSSCTNNCVKPPTSRAPTAKTSLSTFVHKEQIEIAEEIRNSLIQRENMIGVTSPWKNFYRTCSQKSGIRDVVWKDGKDYDMQYLFFKTLDTGRLLPMKYAAVRIQFYMDRETWKEITKSQDGKEGIDEETLCVIMALGMTEIMVLRSFVDVGGSDIPIVIVNWCDEHLTKVLDCWIAMSAGKLSDAEADAVVCPNAYAYEIDLLVRSLLQDPTLEYVPPFILFFQGQERKFTPLFISPHLIPPAYILQSLPKHCGSLPCIDKECRINYWSGLHCDNPAKIKCLSTDMLKLDKTDPLFASQSSSEKRFWRLKARWEPRRDLCNFWGCEVSRGGGGNSALKRCAKCKEVFYCSSEHQKHDWCQHKTVCEKRPDPETGV